MLMGKRIPRKPGRWRQSVAGLFSGRCLPSRPCQALHRNPTPCRSLPAAPPPCASAHGGVGGGGEGGCAGARLSPTRGRGAERGRQETTLSLRSPWGAAPGSLLLPPSLSPLSPPRHDSPSPSSPHLRRRPPPPAPRAAPRPPRRRPVPVGGAMPGVPGVPGGPALLTRPGGDGAGPTQGACAPNHRGGRRERPHRGILGTWRTGPLSPSLHPTRGAGSGPSARSRTAPSLRRPSASAAAGQCRGPGSGSGAPPGAAPRPEGSRPPIPMATPPLYGKNQLRFRPLAPPPSGTDCACAEHSAPALSSPPGP